METLQRNLSAKAKDSRSGLWNNVGDAALLKDGGRGFAIPGEPNATYSSLASQFGNFDFEAALNSLAVTTARLSLKLE